MIIESVSLFNVGVFRGWQTIELAPTAPGRIPIVLVGGQNGRGKTTLLDSIHYGLYGRASKLAKRGDLSWDDYLKGLIHRGAPAAQGAAIVLQLRFHAEGQERLLRVQRDWRLHGQRVKENLTVELDGSSSPQLVEDWPEFVENLIPARIAHLFLFDGEQIAALADPERSREILKTGIHALLGADLVDRLDKDLQALGRRLRLASAPPEQVKAVRDLETALLEARKELEAGTAALHDCELEVARLEICRQERQGQVQAQGGHLLQQRGALEQAERMLRQQIEDLEAEGRKMQAGMLPLAGVIPLLREIDAQATREQAVQGGRTWLARMDDRDSKILARMAQHALPSEGIEALEQYLREDRTALAAELGSTQEVFGFTHEGYSKLQLLLGGGLEEEVERSNALQAALLNRREELEVVQRRLARIPDPESVRQLLEECGVIDRALAGAISRQEMLAAEKSKLEMQCARLDRQFQKHTESLQASRVEQARLARNIEHLERARGTVQTFREALIERDIKRIEHEILQSAQRLFSKTKLLSKVVIDPVTFALKIFDNSGVAFSPYQLSAGERQVLATSVLWGLSKASGKTIPVFIDTPLGRLDHDHRDNLVAFYFPHAGHQTVLLSTEEEITPARYHRMRPWVGRVCSLVYDEETQSSHFEAGRFFDDLSNQPISSNRSDDLL